MTQFTEAFYPAYQGTRKAIEEKRNLCSKIPAGLTAEYAKLIQLQGEIMQLYERLVQLEKLWGCLLRPIHGRRQYRSRSNLG